MPALHPLLGKWSDAWLHEQPFDLDHSFFQCAPVSVYAWAFYCASIGALFAVLKAANYGLHHMFDTSEGIQEVSKPDTSLQADAEKAQSSVNQMQALTFIFYTNQQ
jgi:hypothetical protein